MLKTLVYYSNPPFAPLCIEPLPPTGTFGGTIKRAWNQGYLLNKGLQNVGAEMSLMVIAYNFELAIQVLGVGRMLEALA